MVPKRDVGQEGIGTMKLNTSDNAKDYSELKRSADNVNYWENLTRLQDHTVWRRYSQVYLLTFHCL